MGVITALGELLSPQYLLMMIAGTMGGIMIGAMPGLTSVMGVTLLLPFTYGMDPAAGISMLLAISFGAIYGGSITAILIGTPGTPPRPPPSLCFKFLKFYPPGRLPHRGGIRYNREKCGAP